MNNLKCSTCKKHLTSIPDYKLCGFSSEEKLINHYRSNKHCPCKNIINENSDDINNSSNSYYASGGGGGRIASSNSYIASGGGSVTGMMGALVTTVAVTALALSTQDVEWGPYAQGITIDEDDYVNYQQQMKIQHKIHSKGGKPLWFRTSELAASSILEHVLNPDIQVISLLAEPGSGKTAVIHNLIYQILSLPHDKAIDQKCITITTGMSDTDWFDQIMDVFKLKDGKYLWESLNKVDDNYCISHRSKFYKRITWILENLQYISNHVFIIDENHIADEKDMTIDAEFRRLGLTEEKMKEYNIKIIIVSATPDVTLSILSRKSNHAKVILENGEDYKGFAYYTKEEMIKDYDDNVEIETLIRAKFSTQRYHYIRAMTLIEKGEYRQNILAICEKNNWPIIKDDSEHNYYLSFKMDENETKAGKDGKIIIKTYVKPDHHTIIIIKNKYSASKRLKITQNTGLIIEKPASQMNTTVTCNGLIPRFWGYDPLPEFPYGQRPLFICNKKSVDEYIKFTADFVYNKKSYTGKKITSTKKKTKELVITFPCSVINADGITIDNDNVLRVPKIVQLNEEEYKSIVKIDNMWNEQIIFELIRNHDEELYNEIKIMTKDQITEPKTLNSRKKQIDDLRVGAQEDKKKSISIKKDNKKKDVYQIFMDNLGHQLIITRYYGKQLINENMNDDSDSNEDSDYDSNGDSNEDSDCDSN